MTTNIAATTKAPRPVQSWENEGGAPVSNPFDDKEPQPLRTKVQSMVGEKQKRLRRRLLTHSDAVPQVGITWRSMVLGVIGLGAGAATLGTLLLRRRR